MTAHALLDQAAHYASTLNGLLWGFPFIVLLLGAGLYFVLRLRLRNYWHLGHALAIIAGRYDDPDDPGDVTHFQALCAALSATVGVGNIVGVAGAVVMGGPGAIFWMWVSGFVGMTTKCISCMLGLRYRVVCPDGSIAGGPMYYIERGLGPRFKWLAVTFAVCTIAATFGGGNMVQSNAMATNFISHFGPGLKRALEPMGLDVHVAATLPHLLGLVIAVLVALVIIGGIKRIGQVASVLVPVMAAFYCAGALYVIFTHFDRLPGTLALIVREAFNVRSAVGGGLASVIIWGVKRAVFSNEAGLGSAPIAHAAAKTREPVREGLVAMAEPFTDTIVVCTMTALVIAMMIPPQELARLSATPDPSWGLVAKQAFEAGAGSFGGLVVAVGLLLFAFSTAISWSYYGDRCVTYLFGGGRGILLIYRLIYCAFLYVGCIAKIGIVWDVSEACMAAMAFPNIIGMLGLSSVAVEMIRDYFERMKHVRR